MQAMTNLLANDANRRALPPASFSLDYGSRHADSLQRCISRYRSGRIHRCSVSSIENLQLTSLLTSLLCSPAPSRKQATQSSNSTNNPTTATPGRPSPCKN